MELDAVADDASPMSRSRVVEKVEKAKPVLRGVSHQVAFFAAIPVVAWLVHRAPDARAAGYAAIYGVSLMALLGVSALYHRRHWATEARARMRSLDHSTIFLFIAGSYTPITLAGVGGAWGRGLCAVIWIGAIAGIAQTLFWRSAPRALHVGIYVVIGWAGAAGIAEVYARVGVVALAAWVTGGVLYTVGAVVYARKRPDPFPTVFGYHEVFHALVLVACGCLFETVRRCLAVG